MINNHYSHKYSSLFRIKLITVQNALLLLAIATSFVPYGSTKLHIALASLISLYICFFVRYRVHRIYTVLLIYILFLGLILFLREGFTEKNILYVFIWLHPYFAAKMQAIRNAAFESQKKRWEKHLFTAVFLYGIYFLRILILGHQWNFSGSIFRSSSLALLGVIIALEIFRKCNKKYQTMIALVLLIVPVIGALRQFFYIIVPIIVFLILSKRIRYRIAIPILTLVVLIMYTPFGNFLESMRADTTYKASSIQEYISMATNPENEKTFSGRTDWWINAIEKTVRRNLIIGHNLGYKFIPYSHHTEYERSRRLHNYFIAAFTDGGIVLLIIVLLVFVKNIIAAIALKDYYTILIIYAFMMFFGMNTTALTTHNSLILFYLFAYYDYWLNSEKRIRYSEKLSKTD